MPDPPFPLGRRIQLLGHFEFLSQSSGRRQASVALTRTVLQRRLASWDPLGTPDPQPRVIRNPVKHLDHAKREVVAARHFDIPAQAIEAAARATRETP